MELIDNSFDKDRRNETSEDSLEDPLEDSLEDPLEDSLEDPLEDSLEDPLEDSLEDPLESEPTVKFGGASDTAIKIIDDTKNEVKTSDDLVRLAKEKIPNECAIHHEKGQPNVCSPAHVVEVVAKFVNAKQGEAKQSNIEQSKSVSQNKRFKDAVNKVITSQKVIKSAKELLNCNSESCVLNNSEFRDFAKQAGFKESLDAVIAEFFKPDGPAADFGLLNNINIDNVLKQLEKKFPTFYHIPYQMRDFDKYNTELATIDLAKVFQSGKRSFGVVLNTDYTVGPGIHWFCLFGEYYPEEKRVTIEYFNSSGESPLPEVQAWIHKTENWLKHQMGVEVDIKYSTGIRLQNDDHSCGVYCLMYIWLRLEGKDFKWFTASNIQDKLMHNARGVLFRQTA